MPTCPPPDRKHDRFWAPRLARGLQSIEGMRTPFVCLFSLAAGLLAMPSASSAQLLDAISSINGEVFVDDAQTRYFNAQNCGLDAAGGSGGTGGVSGQGGTGGQGGVGGQGGFGGQGGAAGQGGGGGLAGAVLKSPDETTFQIRLDQSNPPSQVFLWVGTQQAGCEQVANRNETMGICGELSGNPRSVGTDFLVSDLTLQDLLDATSGGDPIVTCESGLRGTPYEIFVFRDTAPGATDVDPGNYGVAPFTVDVEPPNPPRINTGSQRQASFNITWDDPDPADDIQLWSFWFSQTNDPATATELDLTSELSARSRSISASRLGLADGETGYIFMTAFDQAFVTDSMGGNESDLSASVEVTAVAVAGYCDRSGDCGGCAASPMTLWGRGASDTPWILGVLVGSLLLWRRRR